MAENVKKCPFCAEDIKAEAIICRFCGYDFKTRKPPERGRRSSVGDGIRIGFGMFVVLPLLIIVCLIGFCTSFIPSGPKNPAKPSVSSSSQLATGAASDLAISASLPSRSASDGKPLSWGAPAIESSRPQIAPQQHAGLPSTQSSHIRFAVLGPSIACFTFRAYRDLARCLESNDPRKLARFVKRAGAAGHVHFLETGSILTLTGRGTDEVAEVIIDGRRGLWLVPLGLLDEARVPHPPIDPALLSQADEK